MSPALGEPRVLLTGLVLGESPRWHDGRLWLADWGAGEIVAVDIEGRSEVVVSDVGRLPFSIDWLPDGRLLVVSGREGRVLRREPDGTFVTHADLNGLAEPPWNEIVVDGRGNAYVNNTGFDFPGAAFAPGSIALVSLDGEARRVAGGVAFPNGMAVTPDNRTLILAESYANRLTAYEIAPDGGLSEGRSWAEVDGGYPDGICIDLEGAVWYADVPNRCCVRVREGGEVLQTIELDRGCFACMLGGDDGTTLFIIANEWRGSSEMLDAARTGQVLAVEAPAPGAGWPSIAGGGVAAGVPVGGSEEH
jgi:sugar lactone lactonase YvrE